MHPVTLGILIGVGALLAVCPFVFRLAGQSQRPELFARYYSWLVLVPLIIGPILLGPRWMAVGVGLLSLLCAREFGRATGLFRHYALSAVVLGGIVAVAAAAWTFWYGLFAALPPLVMVGIAVVALMPDRPEGYLQRVALATVCFLLVGFGLGHLSYWSNEPGATPLLLAIVACTELNDVFAYTIGKLFGRRKIAPNTSPNKTLAGSVGAALATTALFGWLASILFEGTALAGPRHAVVMGFLLAVSAQLGDLVLSSVKRDLGVKDMAAALPGHGGLLDRFDSLLLVAPALFHYVRYFRE